MPNKKVKQERKKLLQKYGKRMSDFPDEELKDEKSGSFIHLMDFVDYRRQCQKWTVLTQNEVEYRIHLYNTVECLRKSRGVRNWNY